MILPTQTPFAEGRGQEFLVIAGKVGVNTSWDGGHPRLHLQCVKHIKVVIVHAVTGRLKTAAAAAACGGQVWHNSCKGQARK